MDLGLVEKGSMDDRTNTNTLTEDGRGELEERREWEEQLIEQGAVEAEAA